MSAEDRKPMRRKAERGGANALGTDHAFGRAAAATAVPAEPAMAAPAT